MARPSRPSSIRFVLVDIALRMLLPLAGIGPLVVGVMGFVTLAVLPAVETLTTRGWESTQAVIESVRVDELTPGLPLPLKRVTLRYRYVSDDTVYLGERAGPHGSLVSPARSRALVERFESGEPLVVWVDGANPARSTAGHGLEWALLALSLVALLLAVVGGLVVLAGMIVWSERRSILRRRSRR